MMSGSIDVGPAGAGVLVEVLLGAAVLVVAHALAAVLAVVLGDGAEMEGEVGCCRGCRSCLGSRRRNSRWPSVNCCS